MSTIDYTIDTIIDKDIKICQLKRGGFRFGIDSVLLAYFSKPKRKACMLEIGAGSGIISILIAKKYGVNIDALELQNPIYETLLKSIELSGVEDKVNPILGDLNNFKPKNSSCYTHIVCNPPYRKIGTGESAKNDIESIARFNSKLTLDNIALFAKRYLADGGRLTLSYNADMLIDLLTVLRDNMIEPKSLQFVHSAIDKRAKIVLIDSIKTAGVELKIEKPIIQYGDDTSIFEFNKVFNCNWK